MKILIVEDVTINLKFLERLLEGYGEIHTAHDGEEGLKKFLAARESDSPFDLICLDINLPRMNGLELLKRIRKIDDLKQKVKVLMATSSADEKSIIEAIKSGCDGYLIKPYDKDKIEAELIRLKLIAQE